MATLNHTIVAGNLKGSARDDVSGMFEASSSLIGDRRSTTVTNLGGSLIGTSGSPINPMLGPLVVNGGRTMTHVLLAGSPAIDAGSASAVAGAGSVPHFEQRGLPFSRVADGDGAGGARIDIGAFEKQPPMTLVVDLAQDEHDFDYSPGDLSLREAQALANWNSDTIDTIFFSVALSNLGLTLGELPITDGVIINGPGANLLTIDASGNDPTPASNDGNGSRVFAIDDGAAGTFRSVQIKGLRFTGADVSGAGGAIMNRENLTLSDVEIVGNAATTQGGGIKHELGNLTITDSLLTGNAAATGGAVWSDTDLTGRSTLIVNSTISGNVAPTSGGGLHNQNGLVVIRHSTISSNSSPGGNGGGVASAGDANTRTDVHSTIVAGNSNGDVVFVSGGVNSFLSNRYNLVGSGNATGEFIEPGDVNNVTNPLLGGLANNGGPTMTRMPLAGSQAIDAGDPAAVAGSGIVPQFDGRGNPHARVLHARIDIGAVETAAPTAPALPGDYNLNGVVDGADYVIWRNTLGTGVPQFSGADGNGNGLIDNGDYSVWRIHFGSVLTAAAGSMTITDESSPPATTPTNSNPAGARPASAAESAALPPTRRNLSSPSVFVRAASAPLGSAAALDLLMAMEPSYSPRIAEFGGWAGVDGNEPDDEESYIDAALREMGDLVSDGFEWSAI
jgi:hypothetical protein